MCSDHADVPSRVRCQCCSQQCNACLSGKSPIVGAFASEVPHCRKHGVSRVAWQSSNKPALDSEEQMICFNNNLPFVRGSLDATAALSDDERYESLNSELSTLWGNLCNMLPGYLDAIVPLHTSVARLNKTRETLPILPEPRVVCLFVRSLATLLLIVAIAVVGS